MVQEGLLWFLMNWKSFQSTFPQVARSWTLSPPCIGDRRISLLPGQVGECEIQGALVKFWRGIV